MPIILATCGQRSGAKWFKATLGQKKKKFMKPYINHKMLGTVVCFHYVGSIKRTAIQTSPGINVRPIQKMPNTKRTVVWLKHLLSKLKSLYHQKIKDNHDHNIQDFYKSVVCKWEPRYRLKASETYSMKL
jgi:hypothetical protein